MLRDNLKLTVPLASASILALVVIGICAHIESFVMDLNVYNSFTVFGLIAGSITVASLPLL